MSSRERVLAFGEPGRVGRARALDALGRKLLLGRLRALSTGVLEIEEDGHVHRLGSGAADVGVAARVIVRDPAFWGAVAFRGSVGAGETWAEGAWDCDDLTSLIRLLIRDEAAMRSLDGGAARLVAPVLGWAHALRRNTRTGSRRNIAAHYDAGNEAFAVILDDTMTYSCGIFEDGSEAPAGDASREDRSLRAASIAKLERLCRKLRLGPSDHLLEIGTGWGALAIHAASVHGCRVTTTTISREQHELASERVRRAGLQDRVTLLLQDYRDLRGTFDKLVSVEMIEAVGHDFLPDFFRTCRDRLKQDGLMALQAITIADHAYEQHRRSVDFIKRHVFPGSNIPSLTAMCEALARATDFRILHLEDIGPHYARTLAAWRRRLMAGSERLADLGWSRETRRGWEFYFAYCEAGFAERYLGDVQVLLARPGFRGDSLLGDLR